MYSSQDPMLGTLLKQGKKWNNWMKNFKNIEPLVNPKRKSELSRLEDRFDTLNQEYEGVKATYLQRTAAGMSTPGLKTLQRLNDDMIDVLKEMDIKVAELMPDAGTNWDKNLSKGRYNVHRHARRLKRAAIAHGFNVDNVDQLIGEQQGNERDIRAAYYNYLVWLVITITLVSFSFKYMI